jgi:hypothetical protein
MSRTAVSAPSFKLIDFCLIFVPFGHYDEPEILRYAITSTCPIGADVRHALPVKELHSPCSQQGVSAKHVFQSAFLAANSARPAPFYIYIINTINIDHYC